MPSLTPEPGLCGSCAHVRVVSSRRGSSFLLCGRSSSDPRFPRYPRLPVVDCAGWEPRREEERIQAERDPDRAP